MRDEPSPELIASLERLRLADAGQVQSVAAQVRRLAGELPLFQSVWVDALAQARILTPYQAAEINAGRSERLQIGPYVLSHVLPGSGYASCHAARHMETRRPVRLLIASRLGEDHAALDEQLQRLVQLSRDLTAAELSPIDDAGLDGAGLDQGRAWAACPAVEGQTAADWMVESGRFPPAVVLEIARQMLVGLLELEQRKLVYADLGTSSLILVPGGRVALPHPGLRAIVRPTEGYAYNDLPPEGYDCLAPERIADGAPANTATEVYACGCLWWHLLTGRPPLAGGNGMAKLRAIQTARVVEVRTLAPETPETLAAAIAACMSRDPLARPGSMSELRRLLGPPTRDGAAELAACIAGKSRHQWASARPAGASGTSRALVTAGLCLLTVAAASWPVWRHAPIFARNRETDNSQTAELSQTSSQTADVEKAAKHSPPPGAAGIKNVLPPRRDRNVQPASYAPRIDAALNDTARIDHALPVKNKATTGSVDKNGQRLKNAQAQTHRPALNRSNGASGEVLLPVGRPVRPTELNVRDCQTVRGAGGRRPLVRVSPAGLLIESEDTCFEDIDFVWDQSGPNAPESAPVAARAALIVLAARQVEFRGCSFHCRETGRSRPVAIAWVGHGSASKGPASAATAELLLTDCVFSRVAAAVDCRARGALSLEIFDTLHVSSGPLVRLNRCPLLNEPLSIAVDHSTMRDCDGVLEYHYRDLDEKPGEITITASDSAFVPRQGEALLSFEGPGQPDRLFKTVQWNGQGCLLAPEALVAAWRSGGKSQKIDEDRIDVGGLVRSRVEFAGPLENGPRASRITRWQVPLRSADPPGAGRHLLFLGE